MNRSKWYWLIGAKIACCTVLLLVLGGVLSFGAITAFLAGNAVPLAGAALVSIAAVLMVRRRNQGRGHSQAEAQQKVERL